MNVKKLFNYIILFFINSLKALFKISKFIFQELETHKPIKFMGYFERKIYYSPSKNKGLFCL